MESTPLQYLALPAGAQAARAPRVLASRVRASPPPASPAPAFPALASQVQLPPVGYATPHARARVGVSVDDAPVPSRVLHHAQDGLDAPRSLRGLGHVLADGERLLERRKRPCSRVGVGPLVLERDLGLLQLDGVFVRRVDESWELVDTVVRQFRFAES